MLGSKSDAVAGIDHRQDCPLHKFSLKDGSLVFIPLIFYAYFCQSFASSKAVLFLCLFVSFSAFVLHFLAYGNFANKRFGLEVAWVPFFILFFAHSLIFGINNSFLFVTYALLFVCMYVASSERAWVASCIKVLVALSLFHAMCTILFWLIPSLYPPVKAIFFSASYMASDYRSGFTAHYSTNSIYLSLGLVCWMCGLTGCRVKMRLKDVVIGIVLLLALLLTTKRGPLIAAVASISACYVYVNKEKLTGTLLKGVVFVLLGVVAVGVLATFVPGVHDTFERFLELAVDDTGNGRSDLYDCAWNMFYENPIFGGGWGSYGKYVASTPLGAMYKEIGFSSMSAHNVYLQLLAETGIVGLTLFVAPAAATLVFAVRHSPRGNRTAFGDSFCLWACVGLQVFFLIYCLSGNPLYDVQCYVPYFVSIVAVFAICGPNVTKNKMRG